MANSKRSLPRLGLPLGTSRALLLAPILALGLTGCEQRFGLPEPVTEQGEGILDLWLICMYLALGLAAIVLGLLLYSLIRHRRRNDDLPTQTEGNTKLEITYTIIPFILVAVLFGYGLKVQVQQTELANPDLNVTVTGYQWNWRFEYPAENVEVLGGAQLANDPQDSVTLPEMVLPVGERVRFDVVAADVNHSFFVPGFLTKRDLIPGVRNNIEVTPTKEGSYVGHCAEYCGLNHSQMNFRVKVVSQEEYRTWIAQHQKGSPTAS